MADGQIVRFKIGEAFPAADRLARWSTVCAMTLNDLLLVNRWLWPRLEDEVESEPHETSYLGRLAAAHLFEAASFLRKADRNPEIQEFVNSLNPEAQEAYQALLKIGDGGNGKFHKQLKHARNRFFHYHDLYSDEDEEHEPLKRAMEAHAQDEREKQIKRGEIKDIPPPLTGFRARFADDVATEMTLPKETEKEFPAFIENVSNHIAKLLVFVRAALNAYTQLHPAEVWEIEVVSSKDLIREIDGEDRMV